MNLLDQLRHRQPGIVIGKPLEAVEDLSRHDLLARARNQPVIEEDRRSRVAKASDADLRFPESRLELLPVPLVRVLDVGARFEQPLEDEVLDQVGRGELRAASVQRLEDLLRVLVDGEVDDHDLQEFPHDGLDCGRPRGDRVGTAQRRATRAPAR